MLANLPGLIVDGFYIFLGALLASLILTVALVSGWVALKTGMNFSVWFCISIPLPVVALCILLCLPEEESGLKASARREYSNHYKIE